MHIHTQRHAKAGFLRTTRELKNSTNKKSGVNYKIVRKIKSCGILIKAIKNGHNINLGHWDTFPKIILSYNLY